MLYDRVVFFSDAVFAIAATLLVLDLRPPVTSDADYEAGFRAYLSQPAPFIAVAIGFLVVGAYWMSHRRIFAVLRTTTGLIVWANLVFLFFVAIQPFVTAALAEHIPNVTTVVTYAAAQVLAGIAQLGLWGAFLRSPDALVPTATPRIRRYVTVQLIRAPLAFSLSIPIALTAGPTPAMASWSLVFVLAFVVARLMGDPERLLAAPGGRSAPGGTSAPGGRSASGPEQRADDGQDAVHPQPVLAAAGMEAVAGDEGSVRGRPEGDVADVHDGQATSR